MHNMSLLSSEMGEAGTEDSSESAVQNYPREGTSIWLEEAVALEDCSRLRWSLSDGKKEDWEERTQRVTFTRGQKKTRK